jgi:PAS domain-containing protein
MHFQNLLQNKNKEKKTNNDLFMVDCIRDLVKMETKAQVLLYVAKRFSDRIQNSIITIADIDIDNKEFSFDYVEGFDSKTYEFVDLLIKKVSGRGITEIKFPLTDVYQKSLIDTDFISLDDNIYELSGRILPKIVANQIEKIFGKNRKMHSAALIYGNKIYGSVGIITRKGNDVEDFSPYNNIIKFASTVLHRIDFKEKLEMEVEILEKITNNTTDLIGMADADRLNIFANDAYESIFERPATEAIGEPASKHVHSADSYIVRDNVDKLYSGDEDIVAFEARFITAKSKVKNIVSCCYCNKRF